MTIWEYLKDNFHGWPKSGSIGIESEWIGLGEIQVSQESLWVGDPFSTTPDSGCMVQVRNGAYRVQARGMDFGGHRRVARLRALLPDSTSPIFGEEIGTVSTDCTNIAVCDVLAIERFVGNRHREFFQEIDNATAADPGILT